MGNKDNDTFNKKNKNEMIIIYKIENKCRIKIFGKNFIKKININAK